VKGKPVLLRADELQIDGAGFIQDAKQLIKAEVTRLNREGVLIGIDGKLGSAVVAMLATQALGVGRVKTLILSHRDANADDFGDALKLVSALNLRHKVCDVTPMLANLGAYRAKPYGMVPCKRLRHWLTKRFQPHYLETMRSVTRAGSVIGTRGLRDPWLNKAIAYHRALSRQQMVALYYHAELENFLVLGSSDRTDRSLGLFVKYGEDATDLAPLRSLFKTQVKQVANFLGMPAEMVNRSGLSDDVFGEEGIGLLDQDIDRILLRLERGQESASIALHAGLEAEQVDYISLIVKQAAQIHGSTHVTTRH
jgi:NAD+ synthase